MTCMSQEKTLDFEYEGSSKPTKILKKAPGQELIIKIIGTIIPNKKCIQEAFVKYRYRHKLYV